jgi:hypothetical protein
VKGDSLDDAHFALKDKKRHSFICLNGSRTLLAAGSAVRALRMPLRMPTLDLCPYWHDRVHDDLANRWLRAQLVEILGKKASAGKTAE